MKKVLVSALILMIMLAVPTAQAESLFTLGATQQYQGVPRSLFGGVQARQIGDLISIIMDENISLNDNLTYSSEKSSTTVDTFTTFINKWYNIFVKLIRVGGVLIDRKKKNDFVNDTDNNAQLSRCRIGRQPAFVIAYQLGG